MRLEVIHQADSMDEMKNMTEGYLGSKLRIIRENWSVFETYLVRPEGRKFVPEVWKYRIVCQNGKYTFGRME
jgi:hypothetical protein